MIKINNIDYKIIELLIDNGRLSSADIARKIGGITQRAIRYRIKRLIDESVIKICAIPNPKAFGFSVIADVWLEVDSNSILMVAQKMTEFECVSYVACSIGETDVSIQVVGHDTNEIYDFVTNVIGKVPGVRKTTISIVPLILKDVYQWRVPSSLCKE